jgi:hypothetical protein
MSLSYLDAISAKDLSVTNLSARTSSHTNGIMRTLSTMYDHRLQRINQRFTTYLANYQAAPSTGPNRPRPFLYLLLGPPGSGKSHLMNRIAAGLEFNHADPQCFSINLAELEGPDALRDLFERITGLETFPILLIDEFDVQWASGSAVKFLINPIYDGRFWGTRGKPIDLPPCAFFFCGGYLQSKQQLNALRWSSRLDFPRFLADLYIAMQHEDQKQRADLVAEAQSFWQADAQWRASTDPQRDVLGHLHGLEKLPDFLSRVGGNTMEVMDLSFPAGLTQEEFRIAYDSKVSAAHTLALDNIVEHINAEESVTDFKKFHGPYAALVEYKNVLLCERLLKSIDMLSARFNRAGEDPKVLKVNRKLLNYLVMAPLVNGMRSLEQLVSMIAEPVGDFIKQERFEVREIESTVHQPFPDADTIWQRMTSENSKEFREFLDRYSTGPDIPINVELLPPACQASAT